MNQTTFKNNNQIDLIFLKEKNQDRFAFLTQQEIWNGFKQRVQQKAGSKLGFTDDWIVATGAVWQNKLAKVIVANFLSEQRIKAEFFEFFCPISINQTAVIMNLKTNTLLEFAQAKFQNVRIDFCDQLLHNDGLSQGYLIELKGSEIWRFKCKEYLKNLA